MQDITGTLLNQTQHVYWDSAHQELRPQTLKMYKLLRQKTGKTTPVRTNGTVTYREQKMEGVRLDELLPIFQAFFVGGWWGGRQGFGTHKTLTAVQQETQL